MFGKNVFEEMESNHKSKIERFYDRLTPKKLEIEDDPELDELYHTALDHLTSAVKYQRKDCYNFNVDYELEQVRNALDTFEKVKDYDKGL